MSCSLVCIDVIRAKGLGVRLAPLPARVCSASKAVCLVVQALHLQQDVQLRSLI